MFASASILMLLVLSIPFVSMAVVSECSFVFFNVKSSGLRNVNTTKRKYLTSALFWYHFYEHSMDMALVSVDLCFSLYSYNKKSTRPFGPCVGSWSNDGEKLFLLTTHAIMAQLTSNSHSSWLVYWTLCDIHFMMICWVTPKLMVFKAIFLM